MTASPWARDRAQRFLNLDPQRDGMEVYSVGRIFSVQLYPALARCIACHEPITQGQRVRDIRVRNVGSSWAGRRVAFVHEPCWLAGRAQDGPHQELIVQAGGPP